MKRTPIHLQRYCGRCYQVNRVIGNHDTAHSNPTRQTVPVEFLKQEQIVPFTGATVPDSTG